MKLEEKIQIETEIELFRKYGDKYNKKQYFECIQLLNNYVAKKEELFEAFSKANTTQAKKKAIINLDKYKLESIKSLNYYESYNQVYENAKKDVEKRYNSGQS